MTIWEQDESVVEYAGISSLEVGDVFRFLDPKTYGPVSKDAGQQVQGIHVYIGFDSSIMFGNKRITSPVKSISHFSHMPIQIAKKVSVQWWRK